MIRFFRFSPTRLALVYISLGVLALTLFAVPLWYTWRENLSTFREYVPGNDMQRLVEIFHKEGAKGLATAMSSLEGSLLGDEIMVFADPSKERLAGNLPAWPPEIPDAPGTYGIVIARGGLPTRIVATHVWLPGGYHLLMGDESVRFDSLVVRFWVGIAGAMVIVLVLGGVIGWLSHRALLSEVYEISRNASAIVAGDLSHRLDTHGRSDELDALAETVNGMLEQLARQNLQLEDEIAVRRQTEQALHRAHDDLELLVAERTAQLAQVNESLRRSEAYLAQAQKLSLTGSFGWKVSSGEIYWSQETFRIFEYDPMTKPTVELILQRTHPDDRALVRQLIDRVSQERKDFDFEHRLLMPDGSVKYLRVVGLPSIEDESGNFEFVGAVTDITERKQAEQRLSAQYAVTQLLAEAATIEEVTPKILQAVCQFLSWDLGAWWSIDREAGVLRCVELWRKEPIKVPQFEAITRESAFMPGIGLPGRVWFSHEPAYITDVVQDANFTRAAIAAREGLHAAFAFPILLGGDVLGVMEFYSHELRQPEQKLLDVMATLGSQIGQFIERKRAEDALQQAQVELTHVARVATLGEMTASLAHEINQPLGAIANSASACLRWLEAEKLEEARRSASRVIAESHRASEIIGGIRELAKKVPPRKDWLDVNETILAVVTLVQSGVQRSGVAVGTRLSDDVPFILADRIQLQQVILNLMMNAVEAMSENREGPQELWVSSEKVDSKDVLIAVHDSGPGLDPKSRDRLFDAFYTTKPQGLGMGLAISRSLVEAHGGRLWASANEPHGAIFQFTLPIGSEMT